MYFLVVFISTSYFVFERILLLIYTCKIQLFYFNPGHFWVLNSVVAVGLILTVFDITSVLALQN
jgi:hypothetical protein